MADVDTKFGPLPRTTAASIAAPTTASILLVQFVTCAIVLVALKPPFVLQGDPPVLTLGTVALISGVTTGAAWWMSMNLHQA